MVKAAVLYETQTPLVVEDVELDDPLEGVGCEQEFHGSAVRYLERRVLHTSRCVFPDLAAERRGLIADLEVDVALALARAT